jgi:O-antigen/teichoic acid export membrane protein
VSSRSILVSNSAWNALAFLIGAGLNFTTLPFVISHVGVATFGLAGLVMACVAPAMVFSNTLAQMTTRELARALDDDQRSAARHFLGNALLTGALVGTLLVLLFVVVGPLLAERLFHLDSAAFVELQASFLFASAGWMCQCLAGVVLAMLIARQAYKRLAGVTIASAVVTASLIFVLVPIWPRASTFLACQAAGFATNLIAALALARRSLAGWLAWPRYHQASQRRLLDVGSWQIMAQAGGLVSGQADRYILGAFLQPQFIGFYNVAQRLEEAVYIGILKMGETLFPFFSSVAAGDKERASDVFFRSSWLLGLLAVSVLGGLVPVAGEVLRLWTGAAIAVEAERVLVILTLAGIVGSGTNVFAYFLLATGGTKSNAALSLITAVATIATSVIALPLFGWSAAGWSSLAGMLAQLLAMVILLMQRFEFADAWQRILHYLLMPIAVGVIAALVLRSALAGHPPWAWWMVAGWYGACVGLIFGAVVVAGIWGKFGRSCRQDLLFVARRIMPLKVI